MTLPHRINIQVDVNPYINQNSEFKAAYQHFERLLNVDDRYLNDLKVGEMRPYRFSNGDAIVYFLVSETFDNGIRNYAIEIEQFITEEVWEALKQDRGLLKKCWRTLRLGVDRAASLDFYIQIAIAIGIVLILLASKIVSLEVPEIKTRPPVPEQQVPK